MQDGITIRRELKEGVTDKYKIESEVKQYIEIPSMGEQDLVISQVATVVLKTISVNAEKGIADIEATTKVEKSETTGSISSMMGETATKLPDAKTEKGTLDSRNRLVIASDAKATPSNGGAMAMGLPGMGAAGAQSLLSLVELPEKPMKVGETTEVAIPNSGGMASAGIKDLKMTMKFVGEKVVDGQTLLVFSVSGVMKMDVDPSKTPGAPQSPMGAMKMSGTANISGEGLVDKATGKTISNTMTVKNNLTVLAEQIGMELPVKGTVVTKISLVK